MRIEFLVQEGKAKLYTGILESQTHSLQLHACYLM